MRQFKGKSGEITYTERMKRHAAKRQRDYGQAGNH